MKQNMPKYQVKAKGKIIDTAKVTPQFDMIFMKKSIIYNCSLKNFNFILLLFIL